MATASPGMVSSSLCWKQQDNPRGQRYREKRQDETISQICVWGRTKRTHLRPTVRPERSWKPFPKIEATVASTGQTNSGRGSNWVRKGNQRSHKYDITHMWDLILKKKQINLFTKQKQTYRYWKQTDGYQTGNVRGGGINEELEINTHTHTHTHTLLYIR